MGITIEKKPGGGALGGKAGIGAMVLGYDWNGVRGRAALQGLQPPPRPRPAAEPREAGPPPRRGARSRAEAGVPRMRQEDVGAGLPFDAMGHILRPGGSQDLPDNQP